MAIIGRVQIDRADRADISRPSTLRTVDDLPFDVELIDLSSTGCLLSCAFEVRPGMLLTIGIPGIGTHAARAIRRSGNDVGCEFILPIAPEAVACAKMAETLVKVPFPQSRRSESDGADSTPSNAQSRLAEQIERALQYWDKIKHR